MQHTSAEVKRARRQIDADIALHQRAIWDLRRKRNALVPINSIPLELLAHIFAHLQELVWNLLLVEGDDSPRKRTGWMTVLRVCHRWNEAALAHPSLWRNIELFSRRAAETTIQRAKATSLVIHAHFHSRMIPRSFQTAVTPPMQGLSYALEFIAQVSDLSLTLPNPQYFRTLLDELRFNPAPQLRRLSLTGERLVPPLRTALQGPPPARKFVPIPKDLFRCQAPNLAHARIENLDFPWKASLWASLRYLEIHEMSPLQRPSMRVWLDSLRNMSQLETLVLENSLPIASQSHLAANPEESEIAELPSVKKLMLLSPPADIACALKSLSLPSLRHLSIGSIDVESWEVFRDLLSSASPHLQLLHGIAPIYAVSVKNGRLGRDPGFQIEAFPRTVGEIDLSRSADPGSDVRLVALPVFRFTATFSNAFVFDTTHLAYTIQALPVAGAETLVLRHLPRPPSLDSRRDWLHAFSSLRAVRVLQLQRRSTWSWFPSALLSNTTRARSTTSGPPASASAQPGRSTVLFPELKRLLLGRGSLIGQKGKDFLEALRGRAKLGTSLDFLYLRKGAIKQSTAHALSGLVHDMELPLMLEGPIADDEEHRHHDHDEEEAEAEAEAVPEDDESDASLPSLETASSASGLDSDSGGSAPSEQSDDDELSLDGWGEDAGGPSAIIEELPFTFASSAGAFELEPELSAFLDNLLHPDLDILQPDAAGVQDLDPDEDDGDLDADDGNLNADDEVPAMID